MSNSGDLYRVIVATSLSNLSNPNCRSTDPSTIVTLTVIDCGIPLDTRLIAFNGNITNNKATLKWTTTLENGPIYFDIEKSINGSVYSQIATVNGYTNPGAAQNNYSFTDLQDITGKVFYRIKMRNPDNNASYSRTLQLSPGFENFSFVSVINPFINELFFDISSDKDGPAKAELIDQFGKTIKRRSFDIREGVNQLSFDNTGILSPGIYILRLDREGTIIFKKVMKQNR